MFEGLNGVIWLGKGTAIKIKRLLLDQLILSAL